MPTNNHKTSNYDLVLDAEFGQPGTPERQKAEEDAYAFYFGQIIRDARRKAKVSQSELASRVSTTKSYVSGTTTPSVGLFFRIAAALGLRVELTPAG